ncbi:hypothetical protein JCM8547_001694 [Rhodosporidiobolus lusitaniae]
MSCKAAKKEKHEEDEDDIAFKAKQKAEAAKLKELQQRAAKGGPMGGAGIKRTTLPSTTFSLSPPSLRRLMSGPPPGLWPPGGHQASNPLSPPGTATNGTAQLGGQGQQSGASTSLLTIVRAQIVFLLSTLSEDNFNKNRDEIRSLIDLHGPAPQQHLIRRLVSGSSSLLSSSSSTPSSPNSTLPNAALHLRLLASEVARCARDPGLAERFRDAVLEGADGAAAGGQGGDAVLRSFSLPTLLAHSSLNDLSALERLVFLTPFLTLLLPFSSASPSSSGLKRALGVDAGKLLRPFFPAALEQLGQPAKTVHDLAELSPLPISRLFSILLSDLSLVEDGEEQVLSEEDRKQLVLAAVRGRLGFEVGAQALAHAFNEVVLSSSLAAKGQQDAIQVLGRMAPVPALCSAELVRAVLARYGGLSSPEGGDGSGGTEMKVAQHVASLLSLAASNSIDSYEPVIASYVRAVHDLHPSLRWGDVVRSYDTPMRSFPLDSPSALRAFAALLIVSPSPPPGSAEDRVNPPQAVPQWEVGTPLVSAGGGSSAVSGLLGPGAGWANPAVQFSILERVVALSSTPSSSPSNSLTNGASGAETPILNLSALPSLHRAVSPSDVSPSPSSSPSSVSPALKQLALSPLVQSSPWNAVELTKTLVRLSGEATGGSMGAAGGELAARVHELLDRGCKVNPELVVVGCVQVEKPWSPLLTELTARLLSSFLSGTIPSHQLVFLRLSQLSPDFLFAALRDYYGESEMNVTRVVDIAQELKGLDGVLAGVMGGVGGGGAGGEGGKGVRMALDMAALASRREYLNLEKWLTSQIKSSPSSSGGVSLVRSTLEFVGHKVQHELRRQEAESSGAEGGAGGGKEPETLALNAATIAIFMRVLRAHHELFTGNDVELFKEVRTQCLQLHPRLMNFSPKNTDSEPGMAVTSFSPEIESECDALYKRMYEQEISVDKVVTALRQAKESTNQHDHEFFACFLHGLFDEHRFFNTYPANELALTASLFGDLIQFHLIDFVPLGIAVRYVLDALRNPPDSNWFRFGIQALARFQSRLAEWPQLAHSILSIPHVQQLHPEVANTARQALLARDGGGEQNAPGGVPVEGSLSDGTTFGGGGGNGGGNEPSSTSSLVPREPERLAFTAIHVEDAGGDPEAPDESTSDKILFIVNNLAPSNFDSKVKDMATRIEPAHFAWFAHYLVAQRVSIEPNNHQLYQQFLDALDMPLLVKRVLYETFVKLATLLNSDKTVQSSTERTLLKNLGSWLGGLTLAKDKPIKHSNIAFKQLLIEGYDSNRLIVAIPFVCKVLEQCSKSRVFRPPNPWLMAILRLLVELYQFAELKLNLKFEIEVLCKSLDVDLKDVEPTEILRNRPQELAAQAAAAAQAAQQAAQQAQQAAQAAAQAAQQQQQPLPASSVEMALASLAAQQQQQGRHDVDGFGGAAHQALPAASGTAAEARLPPPLTLGGNQPGYSLSLQDTVSAALQPLPNHVIFNAQLPLFATNPSLKRLICVAIDRAVREIIAPVVERSVTIAGISTRELTMKDFAMEGDEGKMAGAAHLMVQNLAGSLALVTCKEPLRLSMVTHARTLLLQNGFTEETLPEQAILLIVAENLELACGVVEKVAMEKAVQEVDEGLSQAYLSRRGHRDRSREAFWDTAAMAASHYSGMLPDPLRLKLGGLSPSQLQVYEDFARLRVLPPADGRNGVVYADSPALSAAQVPQPTEPPVLTGPQAMEKFAALVSELDKALAAEESTALASVAPESDLRRVIQQIPLMAASSAARDETALACSQKVVQLLYRSEKTLARDAFVLLLDRLCAISPKVAKEVTAWLVYAEDERKFNVPVTVALLKSRFIPIADLDLQLAKFVVRDFRTSVVDFVAKLISSCLGEVPPVATREQFANAFEALNQANRQNKATDAARQLLQDVQKGTGSTAIRNLSPGKLSSADEPGVREQLTFCFAEWVRLYQQSFNVEKSFVDFVVQLQKQGILKGEEISSLFFRVCAEVSIDSYIKNKAAGGTPATGIFQPVDAFARLITFMIKYHADPTGANNDKAKVHYMTKVLSIVVLVLANSHEELGPHFQQKPFFRFFSSLLSNLASIETHLGPAYYQILVALSHSLNTLQPLFFPGFTFSWVALVSHRLFMPKLLTMPDREGWTSFLRQLISLFRFLAPFLRRAELSETTRTLYIGAQRILLVLLHDFPDFLSQAAYALGDAIPTTCTQLHNLILSAFPISTQLRLPDPLQPGLKLEVLPDAQRSPAFLTDFTTALSAADLRAPLDQYLQSKEPSDILAMVKARIELAPPAGADASKPAEVKYNVPLINSLVLYLGVVAVNLSKAQGGSVKFDNQVESAKLLRALVEEVEPEPRYLLLSACANALRYPNSHTLWFSSFILELFAETTSDAVKESILTVLLSRLLCSRPQPFAALYVFAQLLATQHTQIDAILSKLPGDVRGVELFRDFVGSLKLRTMGGAAPGAAPVATGGGEEVQAAA